MVSVFNWGAGREGEGFENELGVVLPTGFRTFFKTELDTLTCTSFAGLITNLEHSWQGGGGFLPPPLQNFLEDRSLIYNTAILVLQASIYVCVVCVCE